MTRRNFHLSIISDTNLVCLIDNATDAFEETVVDTEPLAYEYGRVLNRFMTSALIKVSKQISRVARRNLV